VNRPTRFPDDVAPDDYDTSALDFILERREVRRSARVLEVRCMKDHHLAEVLRVGKDLVYVATTHHALLGVTTLDAKGGKFVVENRKAPRQLTDRRGQHIEKLDLAADEHLPAAARPVHTLPAQCKCRDRRIPWTWLQTQLSRGTGWATFEE
jgi:hypothetical protein